ncbi:MAG: pyridoxamine 5'-phosphate oxidase family protein [Gammaproteobacteria bacterium]|jgi:nitroimidazol reductase NimA-like FMN-containing flavoprotein (pyridoxamine 5'-phosphate oxidase superfamily)|nr:pyridoxamine 5'-phosphate oxidase family protein [Gammaproteobacteria bacterium]MDH3758058.1 pyridoxamine 5'-phosphate oxidase family protein [Gammaproteobacteria bacterium]MDH3846505.1 pyridoxamine 5'-phosphate oxidase family protein [Gammaproteobacteria bacterium]MDH3863505.1 pyridoxamine 5'-phosphate oxidase family protein [Gammaproteobacteria bacterium]MDH3904777.1 pyridoxamine 5'-phosphate oxidase family protein [Gammaproteobacteria bacterium]
MKENYAISDVNKVRQLREKARYDRATVHAILDAGLVAHVAFVQDRSPVVVPMIYGRVDETLYLHGARKSRAIRLLERTDRACLNVTLLDGIVLARSAFNSSMNYRSVTVFGTPQLVDSHDARLEALRVISEQSMPGRWDELRAPHEREIKMTGVIRLDIESASAKISDGMPDDEDEDYDIPIWAGVLPLESSFTELLGDDRLIDGVAPSAVVQGLQRRKL